METTPIPTPPRIRAITNWSNELTDAQTIPDTEKKTAATSIVTLRPQWSLSLPAINTPMIEPINAQPTNQPTCISSSEKRDVTCEIVPEMTAAS